MEKKRAIYMQQNNCHLGNDIQLFSWHENLIVWENVVDSHGQNYSGVSFPCQTTLFQTVVHQF